MADENPTNTTAPTTEVTQTEPAAQSERSYTQAEVDQLLKQTKDSAFADARRVLTKPKRQEDAKTSEKAPASEKGEDRDARREAQSDAITDAVSDYQLSKEQRNRLRDRMRRDDPQDPAAWVKEELELFRPVASAKPDPSIPNSTKETSVSQRQPGDHPGGVQGAAPWDRPSDPFKWSAEDVARLEALKGPREAARIIRQKGEQFARTMRIQMSPQRR